MNLALRIFHCVKIENANFSIILNKESIHFLYLVWGNYIAINHTEVPGKKLSRNNPGAFMPLNFGVENGVEKRES
jgi:hypothetical protein